MEDKDFTIKTSRTETKDNWFKYLLYPSNTVIKECAENDKHPYRNIIYGILCFIVVYFTVGIWLSGYYGIILGFISTTAMVLGLNSPFIYLTYRKHRSGYILYILFLIPFAIYMAQGQAEHPDFHMVYSPVFLFIEFAIALTMICCSISEIRILNLQKKDSILKLGKLILDMAIATVIWFIFCIFAILITDLIPW